MTTAKSVLMFIGAGCVGLMAGGLALMGWLEWATRRSARRSEQFTPTTCVGCGDWFAVSELERRRCAECRESITMRDLAMRDAMRMRGQ